MSFKVDLFVGGVFNRIREPQTLTDWPGPAPYFVEAGVLVMKYQFSFLAFGRSECKVFSVRHALMTVTYLLVILLTASPVASQVHPCASTAADKDYLCEDEPQRIALVIGNKNYSPLAPIESSQLDGERMAQRLRELDFDVVYYPDVRTLTQFEDEVLPAFRSKLKVGAFVVFYFSGHGFAYGPDNFLVPTNMPLTVTKSKVTSYAISVDAVKELIESHKPGLIMFFIDACRSTGGFVIPDAQGNNLVGKGFSEQQNTERSINSFIVYAARPGHISIGISTPDELSPFTKALVHHISTEGQPFRMVFDDISTEVLTSTVPAQDPGKYDWSKTDPYLKPTAKNLEDQKEAWLVALNSGDYKTILRFSYRYSVSRHSAACRKWLADSLNNETPSHYTRVSPAAVERIWELGNEGGASVRLPISSLAFTRSLEERQAQEVSKLSDNDIGLISAGATQSGDPLTLSLASIDAHDTVVTTTNLVGRADASASAAVLEYIPSRSLLQVSGVTMGTDKKYYVSAKILGKRTKRESVFIRIPEIVAESTIWELGQSLKEIIVPPRPNSIPELVDPAPIKEAIAELKAQGWKITWVSLSTAPTDDEWERDSRALRIASAEYILKLAGVDARRITSVAGTAELSSNGVRVRFFGTKQE